MIGSSECSLCYGILIPWFGHPNTSPQKVSSLQHSVPMLDFARFLLPCISQAFGRVAGSGLICQSSHDLYRLPRGPQNPGLCRPLSPNPYMIIGPYRRQGPECHLHASCSRRREPSDCSCPSSAILRWALAGCCLNPTALNPDPQTPNPDPSTLNPKPETLNPKPQTLNLELSMAISPKLPKRT